MRKKALSLILILMMTSGMLVSCGDENTGMVGADADETQNNLEVLDVLLTEEQYGIGVNKDDPELLKKINAFIEKGLTDGTYEEITGHYFDKNQAPVPVYSAKLSDYSDQLVVATTGDFAPFDYDEGDAYYGIDKELIKAIADSMGKELVLVNVNFDMLFLTVAQKKCDACIAGITIREDREKYVDFSVPYYHAGQSVALKKNDNAFSEAKTKEDVEKALLELDTTKTIGVEGQTSGEDYLSGKDKGGFPGVKCNVETFTTLEEALVALNNDEIDYVLGDEACLKYMIAKEFSDEN
ncbi:transporter substrate-binding domain-containing protein [Butyrivibrio sp. VCD2006]|uniref:transporter substrate-binding domain-containing protein n=1 Tax=Butyrivibrio sp. VCD2006 TaxID=1280664 RepID=UPI0004208E1C|nr:transporter substrate-binding domain-containing protein [Butyrivibrio sp. VCD2006]